MDCRICGTTLPEPYLKLGAQPLANNLAESAEEFSQVFPLAVTACPTCWLSQLTYVVPADILFRHYLYIPDTSPSFTKHFEKMATHLKRFCDLESRDMVIDIGSNTGLLLSFFKKLNVQVYGVDPALNLVSEAVARGVPTYPGYFDMAFVNHILYDKRLPKPKLITATNVFAHVDDIHTFCEALKRLLHPEGWFVLEVPGLLELITSCTWDTIYHEHRSFWTMEALDNLFSQHNMTIGKVEEIPVHGGSIRVYVWNGKRVADWEDYASVSQRWEKEAEAGLYRPETYQAFSAKVAQAKSAFLQILSTMGTVAGYTAPAKATVIANYCGLTAKDITYVIDDNPLKQNRYIPGTGIPIVSSTYVKEHPVDAMVIFAWNLSVELTAKIQREGWAKYAILPMPEAHIIPL